MKKGQILIDVENYMSSVSLLEEGRLNEFYIEYKENDLITGNIYKGKVMNVLQGLQTAFVNFGGKKNGFLFVGETLDDRSDLRRSGAIPLQLDVKEGDYVMVQVTKEEMGLKGARLSMNISLPGRYLVYLPTIDFIGVSNKITDEETRDKLFKLTDKLRPAGGGFIARTLCMDAKKSDIVKESEELIKLYKIILEGYKAAPDIALIHSDGNLIFRTVRDMLRENVQSIVCNDKRTVDNLKAYFQKVNSPYYDMVSLYESDYDMLEVFNVSEELDKLLDRKITLPSGGSIVIDHTEALTAIDVNTGKFLGQGSHEDTVFKTNLEAAAEIARQLRLRNIGGIIVVDFIDMLMEEHRLQVVELLRREALFDRTKTRVMDMSSLGLVEMTRKKVGNELSTLLLEDCPYCKGNSRTPSHLYVARKIMSALKRLFSEEDFDGAIVTLSSAQIDQMFSSHFFSEACETVWRNKRIYLVPNDLIKSQNFTVTGSSSAFLSLPGSARLLY